MIRAIRLKIGGWLLYAGYRALPPSIGRYVSAMAAIGIEVAEQYPKMVSKICAAEPVSVRLWVEPKRATPPSSDRGGDE